MTMPIPRDVWGTPLIKLLQLKPDEIASDPVTEPDAPLCPEAYRATLRIDAKLRPAFISGKHRVADVNHIDHAHLHCHGVRHGLLVARPDQAVLFQCILGDRQCARLRDYTRSLDLRRNDRFVVPRPAQSVSAIREIDIHPFGTSKPSLDRPVSTPPAHFPVNLHQCHLAQGEIILQIVPSHRNTRGRSRWKIPDGWSGDASDVVERGSRVIPARFSVAEVPWHKAV